jgi:hypothetical protein
VNPYLIEIVRGPWGRYSWVLIENTEDGRRVVMCSDRDYRKASKATSAAEKMKKMFCEAEVVPYTEPTPSFRLPAASFELAGAVPLMMGSPPVEYAPPVPCFSAFARRRSAKYVTYAG